MLKYLNVIRNISERGGNWRGYNESFRTLMHSEGWAWDCINYELWFNAVQQPSTRVTPQTGPPFLNRGTGNRASRDCCAFNQGRCMRNPCPFRHLCRWCVWWCPPRIPLPQVTYPYVHQFPASPVQTVTMPCLRQCHPQLSEVS